MAKKVRIEVHTPFNLALPEVPGGEPPFQKFAVGVHAVSAQVAAHSWVKQHSKPFKAPAIDEDDQDDQTVEEGDETGEDVEGETSEEEVSEEETSEEEPAEEEAEEEPAEEEAEEEPVRRGRGRR